MFKSIRILLAIAAFHEDEIWQMDVKTAFLNENLRRGCVHDTTYGFLKIQRLLGKCASFLNPFMD